MSEYMEKTLEMTELDCLLDALNDLGFGPDKVQVNEIAVNLTGYHGDKRKQKAHVVIPRRHVQQAANDIGFEKTADGKYKLHVSEFDAGYHGEGKYGKEWQKKLQDRYNMARTKKACKKRGIKTKEDTLPNGKARLLMWR